MTTHRFDCQRRKPRNYGTITGFILALLIHGVLFIVGGRHFVKPAQYNIQSATGSMDVDLVTTPPQSDTDTAKSITPTMEKQPETVKLQEPGVDAVKPIVSTTEKQQEEPVTLPKPDGDPVKPITSATKQQRETVKIVREEEQAALPNPDKDAVESIAPAAEKRQETAKITPHPSQKTVGTKSKPGYFQNQPPEYPQRAKQMRQEGLVILSVNIDQKGMPVKVDVKQSSGYQLLDQAALKAVKRWRFQPERKGDIPVESRVAIPVRFRLEE